MNTSSPVVVVLIAIGLTVDAVFLVVAAMKRRLVVTLCGVILSFSMFGPSGLAAVGPVMPVIAACRLARPTSFWARRYYGPEKMALAVHRFS